MSTIYYTIYKITNQINGKFYIGKHKTKNLYDQYMGSGKLIRQAIIKYGIENFTKEYVAIYNTNKKMCIAERVYVIIDDNQSYNLRVGGDGGFDYINKNKLNGKGFIAGDSNPSKSLEVRKLLSQRMLGDKNPQKQEYLRELKRGELNPSKSLEVRNKLSLQKKGKKIITDGQITRWWDPLTPMPINFKLGRT
jgi:hypothetical protein